MNNKLELKDIIDWVMEHKDNESSMDVLSNLIFPFSSKYKNRYNNFNNKKFNNEDEGYFPG